MGRSLAANRLAAVPIRRADRWSLVGLGVVLAVGLATSLGFLNAAWRTHRAYDEYVERARVADLVINPSVATTDMDRAIRQFEGVESVHRDALPPDRAPASGDDARPGRGVPRHRT